MKKYLKISAFTLAAAALTACGANNEAADNNGADANEGNGNNDNNAANEVDEDLDGAEDAEVEEIGDADAEVELTFWLFGATGYDELAEEYVEENPDVNITFQEIEMEDHHNNLFTALSAGSGAPDLALIEESDIDNYKEAEDRFVDLNELGAEEIADDYLDWSWENAQNVDGDFQFGIPTDIGPTVMYYRQDVFEDAGLPTDPDEVEAEIETWEDYREVGAQVVEETGTPMADNPESVFNAKRDQADESYFNEDDELIIDESPVRAAFFDTAEMTEEDIIGGLGHWTPEWSDGMNTGAYATLLGPAWMQGNLKDNAPDEENWRIAAMPEGAGNWGGSYLTIPDQTEHAEEAYDFASWLLAPEQQLKSYEMMGLFPSTLDTYEMDEFTDSSDDYFGGQNTAEIFAEAAQNVDYVYKGPDYGDVNEEIIEGLFNVYDGVDPEDEWEDIKQRVEQRISR
ncbi:ABC transporter substrate-binding protein [Salisediminibacterium halotolerans]|uniref:Cellobiose transport system substrate-binding protein n=1 Tax=Salisediminibacterium halotolerans TaxID=517425 RepID=A0A1H9RD28_9BACI|nr:extracellular solute-binding protein [Salisediminibacterium haloalkalitolerans]SER69823.1 cellobiose transport system substrate-binding protein [Salisediminibacterium haloalkalitolerans]